MSSHIAERTDTFRQEYPFASHVMDLDGLNYHYVDEGPSIGSKGTFLFVHGNPTWSFAWRQLVSKLSTSYRCIAVDHIGCGFSDKPQSYPYRLAQHIENLEHLVVQLNLHDVTLVAHDWGGAIGLGCVVRQSDRFAGLVLMNTAAFRSQAIPWRIALCRIPGFGALAIRGFNAFAAAATRMAVERPMSSDIRCAYTLPYDSWRNRIATLRFVEDIPLDPKHPSYETLFDLEQRLPTLSRKPMQLIWGMQDWCFTPQFLEEFKARFPNAHVNEIPDAGHYVFEDAPDIVLNTIRNFQSAYVEPES